MFSGIQRRRRYSVDQKLALHAEAAQPGMSIFYVARRRGILVSSASMVALEPVQRGYAPSWQVTSVMNVFLMPHAPRAPLMAWETLRS